MDPTIIVIDSDDEDSGNQREGIKQELKTTSTVVKRPSEVINGENGVPSPPSKIRRIQPQKIGEIAKPKKRSSTEDCTAKTTDEHPLSQNISDSCTSLTNEPCNSKKNEEKNENEITKELKGFVKACREVEPNDDMKKIIKTKLLKYYHLVHQEYVLSKFFRKMLEDSALAVLKDPRSVYSRLQDIINELKSRKKSNTIAPAVIEGESGPVAEEQKSSIESKGTGDEKKDLLLKKLNKGLAKLRKEIENLEEEEVDLNDDGDSAYMRKVRYEKRAVEIYQKICEITGESTHAHRIVKQPITFKNTEYKEFNKKLTKKINKENGFPSYYDVYRLLDHCNSVYKYKLQKEKVKIIAENAFLEVGKLLKDRRTNDLYESATHWAGKSRDPAKDDSELKSKLEKNKQYYQKKTDEIMERFVQKQLNGETECTDDSNDDVEDEFEGDAKMEEPSTSKSIAQCSTSTETDLKFLPTKDIVSIIDVKAEQIMSDDFDIVMIGKRDEKQLEDSTIDITLTL